MATTTPISIADYLQTDHEPECELVAGELRPKPMGTLEHMNMERRVELLLGPFEQRGLGRCVHELSCQIGDAVRIPDLVFYKPSARFEKGLLLDAPLLAVEVVSPSQHLSELFAKCETYHRWGVPYCWVIDPIRKAAWEYHHDALVALCGEKVTAGEIAVSLSDLFENS